jgi:hypothetical protein
MSTVQQLEQQLRLAKEKEEADSLLKEFEDHKNYYEDKAFASHKLGTSRHSLKSMYFTMSKLCNFRRNDNEQCNNTKYLFDHYRISIMKDERGSMRTEHSVYTQDAIEAFRGRSNMELRERNIISVAQFDTIWEQTKASKEVIFDEIRALFKAEDYITNGDYTAERNEYKYLIDAKVPLIDLTDTSNRYCTVLDILTWYHHPFLVAKQLINNKYSKQITEAILQNMTDNAASWGGSILERDLPRIKLLKSFIDSTKWLENS